MKKRFIAIIALLCMLLSAFPVMAEDETAAEEIKISFLDVDNTHFAYNAVMHLAEEGIINGKAENLFCPDDFLKREEFAKILAKSFASASTQTKTEGAPIYYDVPIGTWYDVFIQIVSKPGIMKGVSDREFGVGQNLSRQDLAVILKRFMAYTGVSVKAENTVIYADSNEVSDYAKEAVEFLSSSGIMMPRDNNMWEPKADITRAETAQALYKTIEVQKKQAEALGRYGDVSQYDPPYDVPTDDRLAQMMPTPFDAKIWPQQEIVSDDFEDGDYGVLKKGYWSANATQPTEGGYNSKGCIKIEGKGQAVLTWTTAPGEVNPGDYFALSAMVKGENITVNGTGYYTNILAVNDENNKWLNEAHEDRQQASTDWKEIQQILMIPEGVNVLTQPEFYNININLYVGDLTGTVYYDDIKLSKIKFAPMDTVLMDPVYKGIIKGEDGVGDIALRAYINELNGLYDLDNFKFTAQVTDEDKKVYLKSESEKVTSEMDVYFSSKDLPMGGDFWLESIITDKTTGEVVQTQEWGLHKREADFKTIMDVDDYGRILRNGEPYFPISMYNWMNHDDIYDIADMKFIDNVQDSSMNWYYNFGNSENDRNIAQKLVDNGKTTSISTGNMVISNIYHGVIRDRVKEQKDLRGLLTKVVGNWKDFPGTFAYYIFDEQNAMRYGEEEAWARKIIESLDLDHPTTCAIDNTISFRKGIYAKTSDFLGYDPYPATGKPNQDISLVYDRISEAKRINPERPVYAILQLFHYRGRGDLRGPTKDEFRSMAFQAITAGSCMLDAYAYSEAVHRPSPGREAGEEFKEWSDVFREIQFLEPVILSVEPAPYYNVKGGGEWLNTMGRRHNGKSYLFTVNNEGNTKSASIYLDGVSEIKGMYSKKVFEADDNGYFELEWDAYQTEVFEYEQADFKSPHAELKWFNLADCLLNNAESEVSSFVIPKDKAEAEYAVYASDYAEIYINGEKVEKSGKLTLEGLTEIVVKVVSEDGRFITEKIYEIERS